MFKDPSGNLGFAAAVVLAGAIVGGVLGAFSAASTGGNVVESAIEGALTGAVGAVCSLFIPNPILAVYSATMAGMAIDFATQATSQYVENGYYDSSKLDVARVKKTGLLTGAGTAIPQFGQPKTSATDAFGTALIWAEGSALITVTDVIATNTKNSTNRNRHFRAALNDKRTLLT